MTNLALLVWTTWNSPSEFKERYFAKVWGLDTTVAICMTPGVPHAQERGHEWTRF